MGGGVAGDVYFSRALLRYVDPPARACHLEPEARKALPSNLYIHTMDHTVASNEQIEGDDDEEREKDNRK